MPCLPESGGCERPFTDVLVAHLNRTEGARYGHRDCLDVMDRTAPRPETLYEDVETGGQLVVERKSISWPIDYAYRHSNDHAVGEVFSRQLLDLASNDLYEVRLPMLMEGKRAELLGFANQAAEQIRTNWSAVAAGSVLKGRIEDKWWWGFRRLPDWEREDGAPAKGLQITLVGSSLSLLDSLDPVELPDALAESITKIYASCSAKFSSYPDARRILLLDPHGDLRTENGDWWQAVFAGLPPPAEIGEIWSGILDWVTDNTQDWTFEKLYLGRLPSPRREDVASGAA